ncbi:MAG TPA: fibronectin type III domain-containing protein [Actinomycetota bacterium]|nr:fibronectin type III domain-containing protein [Actinomycetota bacterium]
MTPQRRHPEEAEASVRETWRRALAGDDEALQSLLRDALALDPGAEPGRAVRRAVARAYRRRAGQLAVQARAAMGAAAAQLRREANQALALSALVARAPVVEATRRKTTRSRRAAPQRASAAPVHQAAAIDPPPDAPGNVTATVQSATSVTVSWTRPNDYGLPITSYRVTAHDQTAGTATAQTPVLPTATSQTVTGLTSGNTYRFTVTATNLDGSSPSSVPSNAVTPGAGAAAPTAPQNVTATVAGNTATVVWTAPASGAPILTYLVTPLDGAGNAVAVPARTVPGTLLTTAFPGLPTGTYSFGVRASNAAGFGPEARSANVTVTLGNLTDFHPQLPPLSSDPVVVFATPEPPLPETGRLLAEAVVTGTKWRYEYLKTEAIKTAGNAVGYEHLIGQLMEMAVSKVTTAELLLNPTFASAIATLRGDSQILTNLGVRPDVKDVASTMGDLTAKALLLQAILTWLIENEPIDFWVGLFDALIGDVASFDGGLTRTRDYLDDQFDAAGLGSFVKAEADRLLARADAEVDRLAAPLKAAVAEIIGSTSDAVRLVFQNYDGPLLMQPTGVAGESNVPNVNPLASSLQGLQDAVDGLVDTIKDEVRTALRDVANGVADRFEEVMIAFVVLPVLAFVAIAAAGGPFSAAALAAIVMVAVQQLIHLLARWLAGPLLAKLDDLKGQVLATVKQFQQLFAQGTALIESPADVLELLASELLELRELLPEAFLADAAELLGRARDAVMRGAVDLALGAERALGMENATAFDVVSYDYRTGLTPSSQLPGGSDASRLAGAALLADLDRLERQRTAMRDGKEIELTQKLSLSRLLGGVRNVTTGALTSSGQFATFMTNGQAVITLSEDALLDRQFPGLHRALVKEIRVTGVFAAPIAGLSAFSIPVTLTHLGESRTRIKRDANPAAPPTEAVLPECLRGGAQEFANRVLDQAALGPLVQQTVALILDRLGPDFQIVFRRTGVDPLGVANETRRAMLDALTAAIATRTVRFGCGLVDPAPIAAAAGRVLTGLNWNSIPGCTSQTFLFLTLIRCPSRAEVESAVSALGIVAAVTAGVRQAAIDAHGQATTRALGPLQESVGKWGDVTLVEDPDPNVRALGYATMIREALPETAVFNLFRADQTLAAQSAAPPGNGFEPLPPVTQPGTLQYRPFENRGLGGDLLLSFQPGSITGQLTDLILEVTFRACYDSDLAATVKASRSRSSSDRTLAEAIAAPGSRNLVFPGETPSLVDGVTELRTVHLSLRAHRDNLLLTTLAAAEATAGNPSAAGLANPTTTSGVTFNPATRPLRRDDPFTPFDVGAMTSVTLQLMQPGSRPASLGGLLNLIAVTPDDLGFPPGVLTTDGARLVGLGIAVIPVDTALAVTSALDAPLSGLLPAAGSPTFTSTTRLVMTTTQPAVSFANVWGTAPTVRLDFGTGIAERKLYDVIFSLSVAVPVKATQSALSAIA